MEGESFQGFPSGFVYYNSLYSTGQEINEEILSVSKYIYHHHIFWVWGTPQGAVTIPRAQLREELWSGLHLPLGLPHADPASGPKPHPRSPRVRTQSELMSKNLGISFFSLHNYTANIH